MVHGLVVSLNTYCILTGKTLQVSDPTKISYDTSDIMKLSSYKLQHKVFL